VQPLFKRRKTENIDQLIVVLIPQLRSYARSLTHEKDLADDLVQDCLQRAYEKIHQWQSGSNLRAWLFTIMHNLYVSNLRRILNGPNFTPLEYSNNQIDNASLKEQCPDVHSDVRDLETALLALSTEHREIVHLVCVEELSYEEVAKILDIVVGTVMSRLSRARKHLRNFMNDDGNLNIRRIK